MKPKSSPPITHPAPVTAKRILDELESAVADLSLENFMADPMNPSYGRRIEPVQIIEDRVNDALQLLAFQATLGCKESIRALRNIGNRAAESLFSLAPSNSNNSAENDWLTARPANLAPMVFTGDLTQINGILTRESEAISILPSASIHEEFASRSLHSNKGPILHFKKLSALDKKTDTPCEPISADDYQVMHPDDRISRMLAATDYVNSLSKEEKQTKVAESAIHDVIRKMIESKLSRELKLIVRKAVHDVASESITWPIPVSAFEDKRNEIKSLVDSLPLGQLLPFRVKRLGKGGANRDFSEGSLVVFALEYCSRLFIENQRFPGVSQKNLNKMREIDLKLDADFSARPQFSQSYNQVIQNFTHTWDQDNHWMLRALLLPPFPRMTKIKSSETEHLDQWLNAAMLLANTNCGGDWMHYEWPSCVTDRSGYDETQKRHRDIKQSVREKLRQGIKSLCQR